MTHKIRNVNGGDKGRSVVPRTSATPAASGGRLPARVQPDVPFLPGELGYDYDHGGREDAWRRITLRVQELLRTRVGGEIIDWWARQEESGRVSATVLGPSGLALATPITKDDGGKAFRVELTKIVPDSLRVVDVAEDSYRAPDRDAGGTAGNGQGGTPKLSGVLTPGMRSFLGNLPPRLQKLVQEPFSPEPGLAYGFSYELTAQLNTTVWWFGCYLSDGRSLTFASGIRTSSRGQPAGSGHWDAACHRASVAPSR